MVGTQTWPRLVSAARTASEFATTFEL
ncbi:MAG: hypothetical protein QOH20_1552, partial [Mycobacterium sp.]|nr:hypothetical protein [Mycobacterium sp.]